MYPYTILQRAQLFERLRLLQWRRFPLNQAQQSLAPKTVNALMTKGARGPFAIAGVGNERTRKVERFARKISYDFHLVRGLCLGRILKWMRGGDHFDVTILLES